MEESNKFPQIKVELCEWLGSDRSIADSAWTSSSDLSKKALKGSEDVKRVVNMLADSKHSVPFESIVMRFWIRMPISCDRQFMTHRIASHSGMSGRYRTMPSDFAEVPEDVKNIYNKIRSDQGELFEERYYDLCEMSNDFYQNELNGLKRAEKEGLISNLEYKRCREFVRNVLPQGNMTERVTVINLRSFCNFYRLRSKNDAQLEIQQVANLMMQELKKANICPIALEALERNKFNI